MVEFAFPALEFLNKLAGETRLVGEHE